MLGGGVGGGGQQPSQSLFGFSDSMLPTDSITRRWREKAGCRLKLAAGAFTGSEYRLILIGDTSPVLVSC